MSGLIVHEWISKLGGSENVVDEMLATFPDSQIMCLWNDAPQRYDNAKVQETWISKSPLRGSKAAALPFMPATWRSISPQTRVDWMLVSSHLFAHHVRLRPPHSEVEKFVYVHTPARYIWTPELDARGNGLIPRMAARLFRPVDRKRAKEHKHVAANSLFVRQRIRDTWEVEAEVIYPPVDVRRITSEQEWRSHLGAEEAATLDGLPDSFILGASRFVPYKRLDVVIAIGSAAGVPVVLAGGGPDEGRLRVLAENSRVPVIFIANPSTAFLYALYQAALAFVFPPVEDFGIMPVEAMAAGTPVLANHIGGGSESVSHKVSGMHFDPDDIQSGVTALAGIDDITKAATVTRARNFSNEVFQESLRTWMGQ